MKGLAQALRLRDACAAVDDVRRRGVPHGEEVPFGCVVNSPLVPGAPLAIVQPHEGSQVPHTLISHCFHPNLTLRDHIPTVRKQRLSAQDTCPAHSASLSSSGGLFC